MAAGGYQMNPNAWAALGGDYWDGGGQSMPSGPSYLTQPGMMGAGGQQPAGGNPYGGQQAGGNFWGGTDANSTALRNLYGGVGKTGNLIDQEGWNYWSGRQSAGEDITGAFNGAAQGVYADMKAGKPSPYAAQNQAGYANMTSPWATGGYGNYTPSPFLSAQADDIGRRTQEMLGQNNNQIRGSAIAAGGLGGGRQGVAEGVAAGKAADYLSGNLAQLFGGDYQASQGRGLQRYGIDRSTELGTLNSDRNFALGGRGLDLQDQGQQLGFYSQQRAQDQSGAALGAALYGQGTQGQWGPIQSANGILAPYASNGTTITNNGDSGFNWQGLIGGLGAGAQFGQNAGWWGSKP
jgi:hypothetical protein